MVNGENGPESLDSILSHAMVVLVTGKRTNQHHNFYCKVKWLKPSLSMISVFEKEFYKDFSKNWLKKYRIGTN